MTREELIKLRRGLLQNNSEQLKDIYLSHKDKCIRLLVSHMRIPYEQAEDVFSEALLVFRQNILSEKIETLSSVGAYLNATCINMVRESWNYRRRYKKKEDAVRLLLYEKNHTASEEGMCEEELLRINRIALSKLSDKCRGILTAFYVYNIPMKEIAEEYGLANADVAKMTKSRCFRQWMREVKKLTRC